MSDIKPRGVPIVLGGVERNFLFTLNVYDAVQNEMGIPVPEALEKLVGEDQTAQARTLRDLVAILSEDEVDRKKAADPHCTLKPLTQREAGYLIGPDNLWEVITAVLRANGISLPEPEEDSPNGKSGQSV